MTESLVVEPKITPELRAWLMKKLRFPVMATIRKDGMPSQSVVWFDLDPDRDDTVLLNTLAGRVKDHHLRRDPRVSLCFEDGIQYLTLEGRVELDDDRPRAWESILALARRYEGGEDSFAHGPRVNIRMQVERVIWHPE